MFVAPQKMAACQHEAALYMWLRPGRVYKGKTYVTHLLRRSIRKGKTVTHETLGNLSHLPDHLIEIIKRSLKGETFVPRPRPSASPARCRTVMSMPC